MIFTFYSYKGGVGRTMALANIAELFYQEGHRVLMVDWDLEAPGLERFFFSTPETVGQSPGLMDLLLDYKRRMAEIPKEDTPLELGKVEDFLIDIYPDGPDKGQFRLLTAGKRDKGYWREYTSIVLNFDWQDFYDNWDGGLYFEWLRQQFESLADIILIDSRTGVTEMNGICTYQLADVVVMFCAPNQQNIDGTQKMVRQFTSAQIQTLRPNRPLHVLIVPARVEDRAEKTLVDGFLTQFKDTFDEFLLEIPSIRLSSFLELMIPYVPYYAFNETISVTEQGQDSKDPIKYSIVKAFMSLANTMKHLAGLDSQPDVPPSVFICYAEENKIHATNLYAQLPKAGFAPWVDRSNLRGGDAWNQLIQETVNQVDYFIILQSQAMMEKIKEYFFKEIRCALVRQRQFTQGEKFIIPVTIDDCPLLEGLSDIQPVMLSVHARLTEQSLNGLSEINFPEEIIAKLEALKNKEYLSIMEFIRALELTIGTESFASYNLQILKYAELFDRDAIKDVIRLMRADQRRRKRAYERNKI